MRVFPIWFVLIAVLILFVFFQEEIFLGSFVLRQPTKEEEIDLNNLIAAVEEEKENPLNVSLEIIPEESSGVWYAIVIVLKVSSNDWFTSPCVRLETVGGREKYSRKEFGQISKKIKEILKDAGITASARKIINLHPGFQQYINAKDEISIEQCKKVLRNYLNYFRILHWSVQIKSPSV